MKPKEVFVSNYLTMRRACSGDNCDLVLYFMEEYPDRPLIQAYGFWCISKMNLPLDDFGSLAFSSRRALEMSFDAVIDVHKQVVYPLKVFALQAIYNILYSSAGRAEFFDTSTDPSSGSGGSLDGPSGRVITKRVKTLCRFTLPPSSTR
jgi:hypothetical protein